MSGLDTLSRPEDDQDFRAGTNEYAKMGAERLEQSPHGREALNDRVVDIMSGIQYAMRKKTNPLTTTEAYQKAYEAYVADETDPMLQQLGRVVLMAPAAARTQAEINKDPQNIKLVRLACVYNNILGDLVERQLGETPKEDRLTPDDIRGWLDRATGGSEVVFAATTALGTQAEIASQELLEKAGVEDAHRGGPDADMRGDDRVFRRTSRGHSGVDIKTGRQRPPEPVSLNDKEHLVLSIDPGHMDGFKVKDEYSAGYVSELRKYLFI